MKWIFCMLVASLISAPVLAAQEQHDTDAQGTAKPGVHQGIGKVVSVNANALSVKLAHEAIKSLGWPGMTMDFNVANAALLEGLKAGDAVTFELGQAGKPGQWLIIRIMPHGSKPPAVH